MRLIERNTYVVNGILVTIDAQDHVISGDAKDNGVTKVTAVVLELLVECESCVPG
jgi:hypothetical protein